MLRYGPHYERDKARYLKGQRTREGRLTKGILRSLKRPKVHAHLRWIWEAYQTLSTSRPLVGGMAVFRGQIPLADIRSEATVRGLATYDAWDRFVTLIQALDVTFMKFQSEELNRSSSNKGTGKNRKSL